MKGNKPKTAKPKGGAGTSVRATITFPPALHSGLEEAAKQKKVSLAWVVRDATEKYLAANVKRKKVGAI